MKLSLQSLRNSSPIALASFLLANIYPCFAVLFLDWSVSDIVILYWAESVVIILYTRLKMHFLQRDWDNYEPGEDKLLKQVYKRCLAELTKPRSQITNCVPAIYEPFSPEDISKEMARQVYKPVPGWKGELILTFQTIENLHKAIPHHQGDWYFTGNYPTRGGNAVANQAYVNFYEGRDGRPYDGNQ